MEVKTSSDEALIESLQHKSIEALEELYDRHHRTALAIAFRVLRDRNLAEDVIQEAFLAVWRQADGYSAERGSARSWLFSIVRHRAIDVTRGKVFARERLSLDQIAFEPRYPDTWHQVSESLSRDRTRAAVNELPTEQREAISLAYFEGYTQREISERTRVPLGTVKGRIRLGMQKLKGLLAEVESGEPE